MKNINYVKLWKCKLFTEIKWSTFVINNKKKQYFEINFLTTRVAKSLGKDERIISRSYSSNLKRVRLIVRFALHFYVISIEVAFFKPTSFSMSFSSGNLHGNVFFLIKMESSSFIIKMSFYVRLSLLTILVEIVTCVNRRKFFVMIEVKNKKFMRAIIFPRCLPSLLRKNVLLNLITFFLLLKF